MGIYKRSLVREGKAFINIGQETSQWMILTFARCLLKYRYFLLILTTQTGSVLAIAYIQFGPCSKLLLRQDCTVHRPISCPYFSGHTAGTGTTSPPHFQGLLEEYVPFTRGLSTRLERELERMDLGFQPSPLTPKHGTQKKLKQQLLQGICFVVLLTCKKKTPW